MFYNRVKNSTSFFVLNKLWCYSFACTSCLGAFKIQSQACMIKNPSGIVWKVQPLAIKITVTSKHNGISSNLFAGDSFKLLTFECLFTSHPEWSFASFSDFSCWTFTPNLYLFVKIWTQLIDFHGREEQWRSRFFKWLKKSNFYITDAGGAIVKRSRHENDPPVICAHGDVIKEQ